MKTNLKRRDYRKYCWGRGEFFMAVFQAIFLTGALAYFFYRSIWAMIPMAGVGTVYFFGIRQSKAKSVREELTGQFKECILSVSASLKAGYAVENAFLESGADMLSLYGENSMIYQELELIRRGLIINITLEEQLRDLADRSGCPEIEQFAQVFFIAKRSGGKLPEIIAASSDLIGHRIAARQEMATLLGGRKMEQTVMKLVPFGILTYVGISTPGYFDVLYHNWQGAAVMTVCLAIYLTACVLGDRIMAGISREIAGDIL